MRRILVALSVGVVAGAVVSVSPSAKAEIIADSASSAGVAQCGAFYSQPGMDPAGLWSRLNQPGGPRVIIKYLPVPEDGKGTRTGVLDNGDIRIFWDPTHPIKLDGIESGVCESLYHELQHAADDGDDIPDSVLDEKCNGLSNAEWRAVGAQNAFRKALGLPDLRTKYHGKEFGASSFDECKKNANKPKPPPKKTGNGMYGDPHITTTDGLLYDLQQVGEFTAFTSKDADAPIVQVRTAPVGDSTFASMISGVAAGVGDARIAFVLTDGVLAITRGPQQESITVARDEQRDLGDGLTVTAVDADANFVDSAYTVQWGDGSQLDVDNGGYWGMRVSFTPSDAARDAEPRGLLGTFNGDADDDLTRPDGRVIPAESDDGTIRSEFGDSWRISQGDSLFPYGQGESTDTFTDRRFPTGQLQLSAALNEQARTICADAGVTEEAVLSACVFDVAVTGNPSLAYSAAQVERDTFITAVAGQQANARGFGPGLSVSGNVSNATPVDYEFSARAGEVADIRSACTPAAADVRYTIVAVDGALAEPLGIVDACSNIGRVAFATDGRYRLEVSGEGRYGISWRATAGDQRRPLNTTTANGGRVLSGTVHLLGFTVLPGQRWTFTPDASCTEVPGFVWSVVDDTGALNDRGISDGCQVLGPLSLVPGRYDVRIAAQEADADYLFTASSG